MEIPRHPWIDDVINVIHSGGHIRYVGRLKWGEDTELETGDESGKVVIIKTRILLSSVESARLR